MGIVYRAYRVQGDMQIQITEDAEWLRGKPDVIPLRMNSDGYFEEEKAEREEMKSWCRDILRWGDKPWVWISDGRRVDTDYNFCPICAAKRPEGV